MRSNVFTVSHFGDRHEVQFVSALHSCGACGVAILLVTVLTRYFM